MKKFYSFFAVAALSLSLGCSSCVKILNGLHDEDDDDEPEIENPVTPDQPNRPDEEPNDLVSATLPSEGWSNVTSDGIVTYAPYASDPEDGGSYFAFKMEGGVCTDAAFNLVATSTAEAKYLADMLTSGEWANFDDEDDEDYKIRRKAVKVFSMLSGSLEPVAIGGATRASLTLPIPVNRSGKVLYLYLPNMDGLTQADLNTIMEYWKNNYTATPDRVLFGKYDNGVYTCANMRGMDMTYVINTEYDGQGNCTLYRTSITLPTSGWAQLYYMTYEDQLDDMEEQYGRRPELTLKGNTVVLNALILGEVPRADVEATIYALDWLNNCPLLYSLFS